MKDNQLSKLQVCLSLFAIFLLGLALRLLFFKEITMGYDQARDALEAVSIWTSDPIRLRGPMTDLQGLTHGPLYWYLISPFYYFSQENIYVVKFALILINLLGIFIAYYIGKKLFSNSKIALLASLLYAVSFEAVQYARWLSNPSPAVVTVPLAFYGLWMIYKRSFWGYIVFFTFWTLSIQFQFFLVYMLFIFVALFIYQLVTERKKILWKSLLMGIASAVVISSTFIASELKFHFSGMRALLSFLGEQKPVMGTFVEPFLLFVDKMAQAYYFNVFGINMMLAGLIMLACVLYVVLRQSKKKEELMFLVLWLFAPIILVSFEKNNSYFIILGVVYPVILLSAYLLGRIIESRYIYVGVGIALVVILGNVKLINTYNRMGEPIFAVQTMLYYQMENAVDWIYKDSQGEEFGINTVTNPLFINTTWAFMFDSYGKRTFGRMPVWLGYPQNGVYGEKVQYAGIIPKKGMVYYLIIEPTQGIPMSYAKGFPLYEDSRSEVLSERRFGDIVVQKRVITKEKYFSRDELFKLITDLKL